MPYLLVSVLFVLSRAAAAWAGVPYHFALDWMWLADPADLRDRLAETLLAFHAFPPGMGLLTGVLLALGGDHAAGLGRGVFFALGLMLANGLVALGRAAGLSARAAALVSIGFLLTPPAIYFEHLYLYEWPVVTLLVLAAVAFHRASLTPTVRRWALCFLLCAAIAVTRSTFHLVWFVAVVCSAAAASGPGRRRAALAGALPGLVIVLAVYVKNAVVAGAFAASTFGPAGLHLVTVARMPPEERDAWIAEGRLSPFAAISPYAPPRAYLPYLATADHPGWPPPMTRLEHPSTGTPNFNHWFLLVVHRARLADALTYLAAHPLEYLQHARDGLVALLGPTTEWHPRTGTAASPHAGHRAVLGPYEALYNGIVHRVVLAPAGLYALLPALLVWAARRAVILWRDPHPASRARAAALAWSAGQVVYVIAVSSLATHLESARYRFQVEPFIWILAAALLSSAFASHGRSHD